MTSGDWVSTSAPYVAPRGDGQRDAWAEEAEARGQRGSQRIVLAGEVPAPAEVAGPLGITAGAPVVIRQRVMYLGERPVELTDTYYPLAIAGGHDLPRQRRFPAGRSRYWRRWATAPVSYTRKYTRGCPTMRSAARWPLLLMSQFCA